LSVAVAIASGDASADGGEGDDSATYCYCHGLSAGEMIGCDAEDCPIEWVSWSLSLGPFCHSPCP
jgi:hypothetical protein